MKLRGALFALSGLCGIFLPVWATRSNIRERVSRRIPPSHTVHERHAPRNLEGWVKRELVDSEATVPVRIGLKQSNVDAGHDLLMDIQWIQFDAPAHEVEDLLHTRYYTFENLETGVTNIACSEYHVPHNVSHHIDYITPGIKLMSGGFDEKITKRMAAQYQLPNGSKNRKGNTLGIFKALSQHYGQEDLDNYWKYIAPWVPHGTHPKLKAINGAYGPTDDISKAGEEADLDFQVAIPLIWPQKTILFQTDDEWYQKDQLRADSKYPGFFNSVLPFPAFFDAIDESYCHLNAFNMTGNCATNACRDPIYPNPNAPPSQGGYQGPLMCGRYPPTNVISISYSGTEHSWPANYMRRQCLEVMKLALQGVTVVESSGDFGVGGKRFEPQAGCLGEAKDVFSPRVMGNCPYVLSVGATALVEPEYADPDAEVKLLEVAAESFSSGGGFSNVFERPKWQDRHVKEYLVRANVSDLGYDGAGGLGFDSLRPPPGRGKLFNKLGRGYPDVAAIGENFRVVLRGYPNRMRGTSVSTPVWASILTLVNEERLAAGKSTVGFVHQVLVFTDITSGSNPGCGGDGFKVKEGWDPVTGLG
ncbi:hypothetical protein CHGG_02181 [Chaetomium globosum CBS 148.51]|uniref:Peptidase S53 domain-containing protein n=1 Tax=Chaetomium globosum (strain ATCC 6205 / CBS 148.51 / DSM 1962 / NBRC 6347 / NRRL 1970) TaxID=306901 RepID=Q2HC73_CHAGB|nr:uncharacterized protein CHGG_02181 [Chaetomium globosum CBS 148.51]EAQ90246.1 hypothetical protein CHGG_02181 [Chaetomium globosum CBS 148.51]